MMGSNDQANGATPVMLSAHGQLTNTLQPGFDRVTFGEVHLPVGGMGWSLKAPVRALTIASVFLAI